MAFLRGRVNAAPLVSRWRLNRKRRHEILLWGRENNSSVYMGELPGNGEYGSLSDSKILTYLDKTYTRVQKLILPLKGLFVVKLKTASCFFPPNRTQVWVRAIKMLSCLSCDQCKENTVKGGFSGCGMIGSVKRQGNPVRGKRKRK